MTAARPPTGHPAARLRPLAESDLPLSERLYAALRAEEFAAAGLDPDQLHVLLALQHLAQRADWLRAFPQARWLLIEAGGEPVGRVVVDDQPRRLHIVDIFVVPAARGAGTGQAALRAILAEADETGRPVSLTLRRGNPARSLYERLGFRTVDQGELELRMEREPPRPQ